MSKSYCMKCKKEVSNHTEICECGCRTFVYGDKFHITEKGIICNYGNCNFTKIMHMDCTNKEIDNYGCPKCGNLIGVEHYRSTEDIMYLEY